MTATEVEMQMREMTEKLNRAWDEVWAEPIARLYEHVTRLHFQREPITDDMRQMVDDLEAHGAIAPVVFYGIDWGCGDMTAFHLSHVDRRDWPMRERVIINGGWPVTPPPEVKWYDREASPFLIIIALMSFAGMIAIVAAAFQ